MPELIQYFLQLIGKCAEHVTMLCSRDAPVVNILYIIGIGQLSVDADYQPILYWLANSVLKCNTRVCSS